MGSNFLWISWTYDMDEFIKCVSHFVTLVIFSALRKEIKRGNWGYNVIAGKYKCVCVHEAAAAFLCLLQFTLKIEIGSTDWRYIQNSLFYRMLSSAVRWRWTFTYFPLLCSLHTNHCNLNYHFKQLGIFSEIFSLMFLLDTTKAYHEILWKKITV